MCEAAAAAEGFASLELMSTLSGRPLYEAAGYVPIEHVEDSVGGTPVPLIRMRKFVKASPDDVRTGDRTIENHRA